MKTQIREQYVVDSKGKKKCVIVPIAQFEKMIEDLHDLAVVAERRNEKTIGIDELKRRLGKSGRV